jgi:hypothetical protein
MAINKLAMARGASDRSSTADTLLLQLTRAGTGLDEGPRMIRNNFIVS